MKILKVRIKDETEIDFYVECWEHLEEKFFAGFPKARLQLTNAYFITGQLPNGRQLRKVSVAVVTVSGFSVWEVEPPPWWNDRETKAVPY